MTSPHLPARRGRPPKVPREHADTREALLQRGMEVLTEQGFGATGLDAVLKHVGVPKGSFYHYFASKEAFGLAVLARYATYFARKLDHCLLDEQHPPLDRLCLFVEQAKLSMARYQFSRGCLVGNLGQEVATLPEPFRAALEAALLDWQRRVATCLTEAVQAGQLRADTDCDMQAQYFWIGWEGAVLRARLVKGSHPLDVFFKGFFVGLAR